MTLGLDPAGSDVMRRTPGLIAERIVTRPRWCAIVLAAATMAAGTLAVLVFAPSPAPTPDTATLAGTMAFATFVLFQFFNLLNLLNVRSERRSVLHRDTLRNRSLWCALAAGFALQIAVTHVGLLHRPFATTAISAAQWLVCAAVAADGRASRPPDPAPSARRFADDDDRAWHGGDRPAKGKKRTSLLGDLFDF